jgi:type II secretion system protein N
VGSISGAISGLIGFFRNNLGKFILFPFVVLLWIPFIFPYGDLRAVISTTGSRLMGEGTAIDFDTMSLGLGFPVSFDFEGFEFVRTGLPVLSADRLTATPSLEALIKRKPGGKVEADGFFAGQVQASLSPGAALKENAGNKHDITANISGIQLALLTTALKRAGILSFTAQGSIDSQATASIDPTFVDQPAANLNLSSNMIAVPSISIPIPGMGPVQSPALQFGKLDFKGKLQEGKLQIEELTFGQTSDGLSGRVRGELDLKLQNDGGRVRALLGAVQLKVELIVSQAMMANSGVALALILVEKYKTVAGGNLKYGFQVKIEPSNPMPKFLALPSGG